MRWTQSGWFIEPTVIVTEGSQTQRSMVDEIFGPVLTVYIYDDEELRRGPGDFAMRGSPYALTGSIFASNEEDVETGRIEGIEVLCWKLLHQ